MFHNNCKGDSKNQLLVDVSNRTSRRPYLLPIIHDPDLTHVQAILRWFLMSVGSLDRHLPHVQVSHRRVEVSFALDALVVPRRAEPSVDGIALGDSVHAFEPLAVTGFQEGFISIARPCNMFIRTRLTNSTT
jgi:hypothetical protein